MTSALQQVQKQLAEVANTLGYAIEQEEQVFLRQANGQASQNSLSKGRASREGALISEIDAAYKILATTRRKLTRGIRKPSYIYL